MRIIVGLLAILLGFVGAMACAAACGGAWWGAFALADQVDQLTTRADEGLASVDDGLARVSAKIDTTAAAVGRVREAAEVIATGRLETDPALRAKVDRLLDELAPHLHRTDALADSLQSLGAALQKVADAAGRLDRGSRLRSAADKFSSAAGTLGSLGDRAAAVRQGDAAPRAQELVRLVGEAKSVLDKLGDGMADVRQAEEDVRKELPEVRRAASTWKYIAPAIITAVLLWVGLGQLALIGWGRRRLRRPETSPSPPRA